MDRVICDAIEARAVVEFDYDGGTRTVEPYCFGVSSADHLILRGYQVEGFSVSGEESGWKLFEVAKISGWQETGDTFAGDRPEYNCNDKAMKFIRCCV